MEKQNFDFEKYKVAIDLLKYEGEMLWQIMNVYMLSNSVFIGFIASSLKDEIIANNWRPEYLIFGMLGIIIAVAWLGTFLRNSEYYRFRMAQAKELEPDGLKLLVDKGEKFAKGETVYIGEEKFQLKCLADRLKNKKAALIMIIAFIFVYVGLIIISFPIGH